MYIFTSAWRCFATPRRPGQYPRVDDLLQFCIDHYTYPLDFSSQIDKNSAGKMNSKQAKNAGKKGIADKGNATYVDDDLTSVRGDSREKLKIKFKFVGYKSFKHDLIETIKQIMIEFYDDDTKAANPRDRRFVRKFLSKQQIIANNYQNDHIHSVEKCCGITDVQLKAKLQVVYDSQPELLH